MARTALAVQTIPATGLVPNYTAANADGHSLPIAAGTYLEVVNGSGGSINVTVETPITVGSRAVPDDVIAVAAGARKKIAFDRTAQAQPTGADKGKAYVNFSAVTSVTVGAFKTAT